MIEASRTKHRILEIGAAPYGWTLPFLLAFLVNANVLLNGFAWDDRYIIINQSYQTPGSDIAGYYYRPFIDWSYRLDRRIWGINPFGFHLSVYLAHALTTLLLYLSVAALLRLYQKEKAGGIALLIASLFAVHPIHAEAVAWISGRNDVFMSLFVMTALYAYLRYRRGTASVFLLPIFFLGCVLSLLSKETAIPFLLIFPALDFLFHRSGVIRWRGMKDPLSYLWITALGLLMLYRIPHVGIPPAQDGAAFLKGEGITAPLIVLGYYLKLLFVPHPLNLYVSELPTGGTGAFYLLMGAGSTVLLLGIILRWNRTVFAVGAVWLVLGLVSPLAVPFLKVSATPVAERYAYLASGGFLLLIGLGIDEGWRWARTRFGVPCDSRWAVGSLVLMVGLFSFLTVERNRVWRDEVLLWEDTVRKSPKAADAYKNLGMLYATRRRFEEALQAYQTALKLKPDSAEIHTSLGTVYEDLGRLDEALREHRTALKLKPDLAEAYTNLGTVYEDLGRLDEALREHRTALKLKPDLAETHNNLGIVYRKQGRLEEALQAYQTALRLKPHFTEAHNNLGEAYREMGRTQEAIHEFQRALRLTPDFTAGHANLGLVYADLGQTDEAIQEFQTVIRLDPDFQDAHYILAGVYARQGRLEDAMQEYRAAMRLKSGIPDSRNAADALPR